MPSGSGLPRIPPEPAIVGASTSLGPFTSHSDLLRSVPGRTPVTGIMATSGGDGFDFLSTSAEVKANGRTTFPAVRIADAKPGSAFTSDPLYIASKTINLGCPGERYLTKPVQSWRVQGQRCPSASVTTRKLVLSMSITTIS